LAKKSTKIDTKIGLTAVWQLNRARREAGVCFAAQKLLYFVAERIDRSGKRKPSSNAQSAGR